MECLRRVHRMFDSDRGLSCGRRDCSCRWSLWDSGFRILIEEKGAVVDACELQDQDIVRRCAPQTHVVLDSRYPGLKPVHTAYSDDVVNDQEVLNFAAVAELGQWAWIHAAADLFSGAQPVRAGRISPGHEADGSEVLENAAVVGTVSINDISQALDGL
jgi:hypothetical protein